jgi:aerobic carbon-monoxide dehydrogenase medium subunit
MGKFTNFGFLEPETIDEALELMVAHGDDAKIMAGGQTLLILMREGMIQPEQIISLLKIPGWDQIEWDAQNGMVTVGALTTHRQIERSEIIRDHLPLLHEAYQILASVQVRNRGTLGGNLCTNAPGSDPFVVLAALNAEMTLRGPSGMRKILVSEFGTDFYETELQEDELILDVSIPIAPANAGNAYFKTALRESDYPFVSVGAVVALEGAVCRDVRLAMGGIAPTAVRASALEAALTGEVLSEELVASAADLALEVTDPIDDSFASAEYRRSIVPVIVRRALMEAWKRVDHQSSS